MQKFLFLCILALTIQGARAKVYEDVIGEFEIDFPDVYEVVFSENDRSVLRITADAEGEKILIARFCCENKDNTNWIDGEKTDNWFSFAKVADNSDKQTWKLENPDSVHRPRFYEIAKNTVCKYYTLPNGVKAKTTLLYKGKSYFNILVYSTSGDFTSSDAVAASVVDKYDGFFRSAGRYNYRCGGSAYCGLLMFGFGLTVFLFGAGFSSAKNLLLKILYVLLLAILFAGLYFMLSGSVALLVTWAVIYGIATFFGLCAGAQRGL